MKLPATVWGASLTGAAAVSAAANGLPVDKVYGVNLGSWLVSEPWMFPKEWQAMGGEICDADCSKCAAHEFGLVQKLGQTKANQVFEKHWTTWFTQKDVDALADANLNTVRIPLGYWIVEDLVDRSKEFYPQGGMKHLKAGLRMLKAKGIHVILDLHALPGVATPNQMFAGRCTSEVKFYTEENYNRALTWTSVMTTLVHTDPDFSTVFAMEAINEPIMDANQTPGYGEYQKNFVKVVRSVEESLGVRCPGVERSKIFPTLASTNSTSTPSIGRGLLPVSNLAEPTIASVLRSTVNILPNIAKQLSIPEPDLQRVIGAGAKVIPSTDAQMEEINHGHGAGRSSGHLGAYGPVQANITKRSEVAPVIELGSLHDSNLERRKERKRHHSIARAYVTSGQPVQRPGVCLMTSFMNKDWQFNNGPNPADAAIGPQLYDAHLYFNFGGVADPNAESYMRVICNTDRVERATAQKNRPLVFGEWSLATNFQASNQFVRDWSDAQRLLYAGQAEGWIFWSMKIEPGSVYIPAWSYFDALKAGYFSKDPSKLSNPNVCDQWRNKTGNQTATA